MRTTTKSDARPSFQFYPADWLTDAGLRLCCASARGLSMDILCLMWRSPKRGFLLKPNGSPWEAKDIARVVGMPEDLVAAHINELLENGVYSTDEKGVIYSRRMAREWQLHTKLVEAGRKGGEAKARRSQALAQDVANGKPASRARAHSSSSSKDCTSPRSPPCSPQVELAQAMIAEKRGLMDMYKKLNNDGQRRFSQVAGLALTDQGEDALRLGLSKMAAELAVGTVIKKPGAYLRKVMEADDG